MIGNQHRDAAQPEIQRQRPVGHLLSRTEHQQQGQQQQLKQQGDEDLEKGSLPEATIITDASPPSHAANGGDNANELDLDRITTHTSHHDIHAVASHASSSFVERNAAQYERFPLHRKHIITAVLAVCGFLAPVSSTTVLAAIPEVASTFATTGSIINLSNALYLVFMGISPSFWGPLSQIYGRRWICIWSAALFTAFSIGTALAPNLPAFFVFRMLTAFQGTSFLIVGTACIGDIFTPMQRGTALSWFLSGTLIGPCLAPLLGGAIVTYVSWRVIFWMQTGLGGVALVLVIFLLPETIPNKSIDDPALASVPRTKYILHLLHLTNPARVALLLLRYPNLFLVGLGSSALVWNMYSLLTPIRYVLNPRFGLTSPMQSGLFFIAPGCGYLLGTFFGGHASDAVVKHYILRRGNRRISEDRLRTCLPFLGAVIPGCMLVYGWPVDRQVGGIALAVVAMFTQGVAQLMCFPSLNTYCIDVMQSRGQGAMVVAGNYQIRYLFAAAGSAVCLPAIEHVGVGWFSTVSSAFLVVSALLVWWASVRGEGWRKGIDAKRAWRRAERVEKSEKEKEKEQDREQEQEVKDGCEQEGPR